MKKRNMAIKADATLVSSAFRLGQSYISNDHSAIFNKQFEGLIDAYRTKGRGLSRVIEQGVRGSMELGGKLIAKDIKQQKAIKAEIKDELGWFTDVNEGIKDLSRTNAVESAKQEAGGYEKNQPPNASLQNVNTTSFEQIRDGLKDLNSQKFIGKKGKQKRAALRGQLESLREKIIAENAAATIATATYGGDEANLSRSFEIINKDGTRDELTGTEYETLFAQVINRSADLEGMGIKSFRGSYVNGVKTETADGDLYFEASPNRLFQEYLKNQGGREAAAALGKQAELTDTSKDKMVVRYLDLMNMIRPKDRAAERKLNDIVTSGTKLAEEMITQADGKSKGLLHTDYSEVESSVKSQFKILLNAKETNLEDLLSRDIQVGGQDRNFGEDFKKSPSISTLRYSSLGLTGSVDKNNDNMLTADELTEEDKEKVIQRYLRPTTLEEKQSLINDVTDWYSGHTKTAFDNHRKKMGIGVEQEEADTDRRLDKDERRSREQRIIVEKAIENDFDINDLSNITLVSNRVFQVMDDGDIAVIAPNADVMGKVNPKNFKGLLRLIKENSEFLLPLDKDAIKLPEREYFTEDKGRSRTTMMANFPSTTGGSVDDF